MDCFLFCNRTWWIHSKWNPSSSWISVVLDLSLYHQVLCCCWPRSPWHSPAHPRKNPNFHINCSWKNRKSAVQGSLLYVFPIEVVFGGDVVENGSGLYYLHSIHFHHWHLLEQQISIFWKKKGRSRVKCLIGSYSFSMKNHSLPWLRT